MEKDDGTVEVSASVEFCENVAIPSEIAGKRVTSIGEGAFSYFMNRSLKHIKNVTIPDGVVSIAENAFSCQREIEEIILPSSVRVIDAYAFWNCPAKINIPENVEYIGYGAFADTNIVYPTYSSASELVYTLLDEELIDYYVACALYVGIIHDSGVFKYSNTSLSLFVSIPLLILIPHFLF